MDALPSLIAFGALASWPARDWQLRLKTTLKEVRTLKPIVAALLELPSLWDTLTTNDPSLRSSFGQAAATELAHWMIQDTCEHLIDEKRNALTMPMTVISHIMQYLEFLKQSNGVLAHGTVLESVTIGGGIQGFCAGLLSALAVASATSEDDIAMFAANSIRLAFCVGAYIDLDQASSSAFTTLAVRWTPTTSRKTVEDLLATYPETYIAVLRDDRDATVTCPTSIACSLKDRLTQSYISVRDTGMPGRYHTQAHKGIPERILKACNGRLNPSFTNTHLVRSNTDGTTLTEDKAAIMTLHSMLEDQACWYSTISTAATAMSTASKSSYILAIGLDAVPPSVAKEFPTRRMSANTPDVRELVSRRSSRLLPTPEDTEEDRYSESAIAVIGMACKFPGADSVDDFWSLLKDGRSMLSEMPPERFKPGESYRSKDDTKFRGNFIDDISAWDHKFFRKSAREAASTDPQQRHLLQVTYQALQDSGYFSDPSRAQNIGAYIGACSTDYDFNVASHAPTAYSTVGTLRAFLSGKLSHHFGWSGPSLTFDTACSSSAVAIHTACKALQTGECSQAVAGGATLFSSPYLCENLAAAHFLSPTGATKPFDASADGYCRGEGVGVVVLKRLGEAIADGDSIRGVILGSAVNQNNNCVPITVPHSTSQAALYRKAAKQAGIDPRRVDFVEAHGTGTPVGDPIEMESIRDVFGSTTERNSTLFVSSVKGAIGHLEGASGVAALIKAILQMEHRAIVPQASFTRLNPRIPPLETHRMCIPTSLQKLDGHRLTACINNYGAAGSNATLMLAEAPRKSERPQICQSTTSTRYPIRIAAASSSSMEAYCDSLDRFISSWLASHSPDEHPQLLPSLAYSLSKHEDQKLSHLVTFASTSTDIGQLQSQLRKQSTEIHSIKELPKEPPLVLCFGGQGADTIALDRGVWQSSSLLRSHLDRCHELLCNMGYPGIYPYIFQAEPVTDVIAHNSMLFAMQYACAQSWIDSGLKVDSLIGHSLGQITALSVSGILSLQDGLKFVAGRAALMLEHWGSEPGSMVVLDANEFTTTDTITTLHEQDSLRRYEIACYNGPKCHVVVSDRASMTALTEEATKRGIRYKQLTLQYGFHSRFTDALYPHLEQLAESLEIHEPRIPLESCTVDSTWERPTARLIAAHTRDPVYFTQAVERVHDRLGACTWLEAGSNSTVIGLTARIVGRTSAISSKFIPVALNKPTSLDQLTDVTIDLWKRGHKLRYWNFHRSQNPTYDVLRLPPYAFDKHRHWLELTAHKSPTSEVQPHKSILPPTPPARLISLERSDCQGHHFIINPLSEEYQNIAKGHNVLGMSSCPPSVYIDLAARATLLAVRSSQDSVLPQITGLQVGPSMSLAAQGEIKLLLEASGPSWKFSITSVLSNSGMVQHASGMVSLQEHDRAMDGDFARFEMLAHRSHIPAILSDPIESLQGPMVYKVLSSRVDYAESYRGVRSVATRGNQIAAKVVLPSALKSALGNESIINTAFLNYITQVAGIHANFMCDSPPGHISKLASIDVVRTGPSYRPLREESFSEAVYEVLAYTTPGAGSVANDIFVYEVATGRMALYILGAVFKTMEAPAAIPQLSRKTVPEEVSRCRPQLIAMPHMPPPSAKSVQIQEERMPTTIPVSQPSPTTSAKNAIDTQLCRILEEIAEISPAYLTGKATFESLGIDSLMIMEIVGELSSTFNVDLPLDELMELVDVDDLMTYLESRGCGSHNNGHFESDVDKSSAPSSVAMTRSTSYASTDVPTTPASEASPAPDAFSRKLSVLICEHLELDNMQLREEDNLADVGLDSLVAIEIASDVKRQFCVDVDMEELDEQSTFADFLRLVMRGQTGLSSTRSTSPSPRVLPHQPTLAKRTEVIRTRPMSAPAQSDVGAASRAFDSVKLSFDRHAEETGFTGFWANVYPDQSQLVVAYVGEAFEQLGCDIRALSPGVRLSTIKVEHKHQHLLERMYLILTDAGLLEARNNSHFRTQNPCPDRSSTELYADMLERHPKHASETKLLHVTASRLASCLIGAADPLRLLFADPIAKQTLSDVYDSAPMCQATTRVLADYLHKKHISSNSKSQPFRILEVGAGTGGTARYLIEFLQNKGIDFEYHFTDISGALVSAAKRKFRSSSSADQRMHFSTLDCNTSCPSSLRGEFDVVIATNCIHATPHASRSCGNVKDLLKEDGVFCLVEFTRSLYWFDLVYGLLEGWWLFDDGRSHALADEGFWEKSLRDAGFGEVNWTDGDTLESQTMRLICAFP